MINNDSKKALKHTVYNMPDNCLTATEAREKTNKIRNNNNSKQFENIFKLINEAINKGEYCIYIINKKDLFITPEMKKILMKLGYKVETSNQYNEIMYTISWKEE